MAKRGIEFQVNWIFILIAGALIIAFFFGIVQKQRTVSEQKLSIKLSDQMEAVFAGAIESKGTTQPLSIPQAGIAFSCSKVCDCNWYIGKKSNSFYDNLIFAPDLIKGTDAVAVAHEWKIPFRVANFLYLTNPNVKYYIFYSPSTPSSMQLFDKLTKVLPKTIDFEVILDINEIHNIKPQGHLHTKFVFLGTSEPGGFLIELDEWKKESMSAVFIDSDQRVIFYKKKPDAIFFESYVSYWAEEELMLAAVYAADADMYNCGLKKALAKLSTIAKINQERATELQSQLAREECVYSNAVVELSSVAEASDVLSKNLRDYVRLMIIINAQKNLIDENENILRQGCPSIF